MCTTTIFISTHYMLKINTLYNFGVWQGFKNLVMKKPRRDLLYIRARVRTYAIHYTPYTAA